MGGTIAGCYGHRLAGPEAASFVAAESPRRCERMLGRVAGRYTLRKADEVIGFERFTVTSSGALGVVEGLIERGGEAGETQRYRLAFDSGSGKPEALEIALTLFGARRVVQGKREGTYFVVRTGGIGRPHAKRIPLSDSTVLSFPSFAFRAVALCALALPLAESEEALRAVALAPPFLVPVVVLERYARSPPVDSRDETTSALTLTSRAHRAPIKLVFEGSLLSRMVEKSDGGLVVARDDAPE